MSQEETNLDRILKRLDQIENGLKSFQTSINQQLNDLEIRIVNTFQSRLGDILKRQFETELHLQISDLPCDLPDVEIYCKTRKKTGAKDYLNLVLGANWDDAHRILVEYQGLQKNSSDEYPKQWSKENPQCISCAKHINQNVLENHLLTLEALYSSFYSRELPSKIQDLDRIDPEELYENRISPISNKLRVILLILIFRGYRRFNELKAKINSSSSTTDHHLKKLLKHGLITQENKDYKITPDGVNVLSTLLHLSSKVVR